MIDHDKHHFQANLVYPPSPPEALGIALTGGRHGKRSTVIIIIILIITVQVVMMISNGHDNDYVLPKGNDEVFLNFILQ